MRKNFFERHRCAIPRRGLAMKLEWLVVALICLSAPACSLDGLLGNDKLPENVTDPAITETPKGALRAYYGTVSAFRSAFNHVVNESARLTDELQSLPSNTGFDLIDMRELPDGGPNQTSTSYSRLNEVRGQAVQAIGLHRDHAPDSLSALLGHLYALYAYAEIYLADLYCSGIPLSTLDYKGDFTYRPGSTTEQVYEHALVLLDTALTFAGDSTRFKYLAQLGTARALLNLGRVAEAAAAVAGVPDDFRYEVEYGDGVTSMFVIGTDGRWNYSIGDSEGVNGLDYRSSGDPRTQTTTVPGPSGATAYFPAKYQTDGMTPIVVASGIEARLIEAEAALDEGDVATWLGKLNHLRQTMWTTIVPAAAGPLPDLTDPGTEGARIDLLYRERAFWLFLTGQRQGDLRRLIRNYGRTQDQLYPVGPYPGAPGKWYGAFADLPVSPNERVSNPYYDGCFSRS